VDKSRFADVPEHLAIQEREARWWRDAALEYFQTFSRMPIPPGYERPAHPLEYYQRIRCPADEHKPRCADVP
jgi:alpha-glucuronidase